GRTIGLCSSAEDLRASANASPDPSNRRRKLTRKLTNFRKKFSTEGLDKKTELSNKFNNLQRKSAS
ncbi:MAG TPA: hypothetical protein VGL22_02520, partial [Terracidiphilus sp.]